MPDQTPLRVFIGLAIPAKFSDELGKLQALARKVTATLPGKWVAPANWHITLNFIGNLNPAQVERLGVLLKVKYRGYQPFAARLAGVRWFPGKQKPRMIVAEVQLDPQLLAIKLRSDQALKELEIEPDARTYRPHITLARFKTLRSPPPLPEIAQPLPAIQFENITLFQSIATQSGVNYVPLQRIGLESL